MAVEPLQFDTEAGTAVSSRTPTLTTTVTTGSRGLLLCGNRGTIAPDDPAGWTKLYQSAAAPFFTVWAIDTCPQSVTVTLTGSSTHMAVALVELPPNLQSLANIDETDSSTTGTATTVTLGPTGTLAQSEQAALAALFTHGNNGGVTWPAGWAEHFDFETSAASSGASVSFASDETTTTSAVTVAPTWVTGRASQGYLITWPAVASGGPQTVVLGQATETDTARVVLAAGESTLSTYFPGSSLPPGWTEYDPANHGTVTVADSRAILTPGAGVHDSIFSVGSSDSSIGIQHPITTDDLDVAVRIDGTPAGGDHGDVLKHSVNLLAIGATTADMVRFSLYQRDADFEMLHAYIYTRSGGSGAAALPTNTEFTRYFGGAPNWYRLKYTAATGLWQFLTSSDGFTWHDTYNYGDTATMSATRTFTPQTFVVSMHNGGGETVPIRVGRVVDMLTAGTTDLREGLPALTQVGGSTVDGTAGALPPGWTYADLGSEFSHSWTGTALRLEALNATSETPNLTGIRSAIRYTDVPFRSWRLYIEATNPVPDTDFYFTPGMAADPVGTNGLTADGAVDQYTWGGGYGLEVQSGTIRRPIRLDDDSDKSHNPVPPFSTGLDETPYTHLKNLTGPTFGSGTHHFLFERLGGRYRVKEWTGLRADEPVGGWYYDGDDFINDFPVRPWISLSYNNTGGSCQVDLRTVEFTQLVAGQVAVLSQPAEVDTAQPLTRRKAVTLGRATEASTTSALTITLTRAPQVVALGQVVEIVEAAGIPARKTRTLGRPVEVGSVLPFVKLKRRVFARAVEVSTAGVVAPPSGPFVSVPDNAGLTLHPHDPTGLTVAATTATGLEQVPLFAPGLTAIPLAAAGLTSSSQE